MAVEASILIQLCEIAGACSGKQTPLVPLTAAWLNELDQHSGESGLARHCQANRLDIDELIPAGEFTFASI